jgi:glycine/D-amino acid oxidase-like deaminating enzyme
VSPVSPAAAAGWPTRALAAAEPNVYWLVDPARPEPLPPLSGVDRGDLVVVGGGYTGLWSALRAKERDPARDVVLLEAGTCGDQASGRNGGFASASLTHGFGNGVARWPEELATLDRLGARNLAEIGQTVRRYGIDCGWEESGELMVATATHQVEELAELGEQMAGAGHDVQLLDQAAVQAEVASPTYLSGLWDRRGTAMVEPARLAWGLRRACRDLGVRVYEHSPVYPPPTTTRTPRSTPLSGGSGSGRAGSTSQ